jgi:hypothetical protein
VTRRAMSINGPDPPGACEYCGAEGECDCEDRIACKKAGQVGHWACGWCAVHSQPRFHCGLRCLIKGDHDE